MRVVVPLTLRVVMEAGIVAGLAYWGYHTGSSTRMQIMLAVVAPVIGFGLWGGVDFRWAGRLSEPLRLLEELAISGLAALAFYAAGQRAVGVALAALSIVYHAMVYVIGGRLLDPDHASRASAEPVEVGRAATFTVRGEFAGASATITCTGRINSGSRGRLESVVRECLAHKPWVIRFDLHEAWIDSGGIALVLALYDECLSDGVRVEATTAPAAREIFSRLGLPLRFRVDDGQVVRVIPTSHDTN